MKPPRKSPSHAPTDGEAVGGSVRKAYSEDLQSAKLPLAKGRLFSLGSEKKSCDAILLCFILHLLKQRRQRRQRRLVAVIAGFEHKQPLVSLGIGSARQRHAW